MLNKLSKEAVKTARKRGKHYNGFDVGLFEIVKEIVEASNAREEHSNYKDFETGLNEDNFKQNFEMFIKDTLEDELADVVIRTLSLAGELDIDIQKAIELKMKYNNQRED